MFHFAEKYTNYQTFAYYDECVNIVIGVIIFLANLKLLRLLRFNRHILFLSTTMRKAGMDLIGFTVTFFIFFLAYGFMGTVLFGQHLQGFRTLLHTLESLYSMLLGKFDFNGIRQAQSWVALLKSTLQFSLTYLTVVILNRYWLVSDRRFIFHLYIYRFGVCKCFFFFVPGINLIRCLNICVLVILFPFSVLGPLFFVTFVMAVYFILVNMLIGILGLAFYEVNITHKYHTGISSR